MPPGHAKRGDVAASLCRVKDFFRKKRGAEETDLHGAHGIRELLKQDRDALLRDFERILDNKRASESLVSPSELHVASPYRSVATQTEVHEEPARPTTPGIEEAARQIPTYTSSSTQVEMEMETADETEPSISADAASLRHSSRGVGPTSDASGELCDEEPEPAQVVQNESTSGQDTFSFCVPIRETKRRHASSASDTQSDPSLLAVRAPPVSRPEPYIFGTSGAARLIKKEMSPLSREKRRTIRRRSQASTQSTGTAQRPNLIGGDGKNVGRS
ncbi:hypothetical protein C2857_005102 [Epichloe festucae Fl1]|uniref:Uncharacterized protein n=1 Tax=Epichloe festucae (strain Fl1) TaxID=877507 RepID=A0A7S9KPC8_EPIFF|nr:hypothetical protein C2857_005102 [Epichloe festucae Fl1]